MTAGVSTAGGWLSAGAEGVVSGVTVGVASGVAVGVTDGSGVSGTSGAGLSVGLELPEFPFAGGLVALVSSTWPRVEDRLPSSLTCIRSSSFSSMSSK
ncbi:Uncharacterised protein [Flavonifractor plautii]|uniref:Uncharacterized protein n=1 Tax=Flavonifractor plautii TaxID=292800 RepID=A0A174TM47_FLAPL|nr:Uncharacterised protein [Flavonifractor plautii]